MTSDSHDIARRRLGRQGIAPPAFDSADAVVRWMGAMQAQDYHQSLWAIGARMPSATLRGVEAAIAEGKILRTWPMRGTIHFVAPEDAGWMVALSAERTQARNRRRPEELELDDATLARSADLFHKALAGGKRLARPAMMTLLEEAGIRTDGQRGYHILWHAAHERLICIGPNEGKQQTFVLLDDWAPNPRRLTRKESLVELARRYFTSHGPATVQDFAWWTGLTLTEARLGLEGAKDGLASETLAGKLYLLAADAPESPPAAASGIFLLAGFDEILLGYTDRSAMLDPAHAAKVVPGGNGVFFPMIVRDGQIVGTWKRTVKKKAVEIAPQFFEPPGAAQIDLTAAAAARYAAFHELPAVVL
ncbi:MAG: AlkZ family DNA glycosylase [Chloroflexi bacterium]|nr:AlkZ family DNA glycosylase [Chloroflexota bacterium]